MKNFIFASILLALLLTVNAATFRRALTFVPCDLKNAVNVAIVPKIPKSGKNESFHISGILTEHDITAQKTKLSIAYEDINGKGLGKPYTQPFTASTKAGNPFSLSATRVPTPKLPSSYLIKVAVEDPSNAIPLGCALARVEKI
ncbi:hypothetical protein C2G38_610792 [Gigaspora rosea]|uniref:MD-2-related lipid-recognition domain-containing protein n=1 Tax=Gigaspora rosea TaxID=44941 RepID=A0A397VUX7_9GLOM|nr:hypothetical protein C2G38_610792 [Gigaspora rosea]